MFLLIALFASHNTAYAATATPVPTGVTYSASCANASEGYAHCMALSVTPGSFRYFAGARTNAVKPQGLSPADLQSAYNLPSATAGKGKTVAIIDAYDNPNAESDLNVYRQQYGLKPCTTANGCFKKIDERGTKKYPRADKGWAQEIALDLAMVSAICPNCNILLVEADSNSFKDLGTAVNTAAKMGVQAISNSYGGKETKSIKYYESTYYNHPGIAITASSGDNGFGAQFPASSRYVVAVGGTSLKRASNARGWNETIWKSAGSGCSEFIEKPVWQSDSNCGNRTIADVAAVADPTTGVAVYNTYGGSGWGVFGGTSASAPIIAAVYAMATNTSSINHSEYLYKNASKLNDISGGSNGICSWLYLCTGVTGYDGPTGLGTPNGLGAF